MVNTDFITKEIVRAIAFISTLQFHRGRWYEVARYSNKLENQGDCVYLDHNIENGQYKITLNEVLNKNILEWKVT